MAKNWGIPGIPGLPDFPDPRDDLVGHLVNQMLTLTPANLVAQGYFDIVGFFGWFAIRLWAIHLVVAVVRGFMKNDILERLRDWVLTGLFLLVALPTIPGLLVACQTMLNILGKYTFLLILGTDNAEEGIATLSTLTGVTGLDLILSTFQIGFMTVLTIELYMVTIAMYASVLVMITGISLRFLGSFGEALFALGVGISIFGVAGNAVVLVIIGGVVGFGRLVTHGEPFAMGIINTGAMLLAMIALPLVIKSMKRKLNATVTGVVSSVGNVTQRSDDRDSGYTSNGGSHQVDQSTATHRRHTRDTTSTSQGQPGTTSQKTTNQDTRGEQSDSEDPPQRRYSSVLARSQPNDSSRDKRTSQNEERQPGQGGHHPASANRDEKDSTSRNRQRQTDSGSTSDPSRADTTSTRSSDTSTRRSTERPTERSSETPSGATHRVSDSSRTSRAGTRRTPDETRQSRDDPDEERRQA